MESLSPASTESTKMPSFNFNNFNLKGFILKLLSHWYLYLITLILALTGAFLYAKYSTPQFRVASTIMLRDSKSGNINDISPLAKIDMFNSNAQLSNEIVLLKSRT